MIGGDPSSPFGLRRDKEDLNLRPLRPERSALARLSHTPTGVSHDHRAVLLIYHAFDFLQAQLWNFS